MRSAVVSGTILVSVILAASLVACAVVGKGENARSLDAPLVALLANPELYDGGIVRTEGYFTLFNHDGALFLTTESAHDGATYSGIRVVLPDSEIHAGTFNRWIEKRVIVEGKFRAPISADYLRGAIVEISAFIPFETIERRVKQN